jgi:TolB-like protein
MSLIAELRRRNVFRVGVAYAIVAWLLIQVADTVLPTFEAPAWVLQVFTFLVILGFPLALILAWAFELTPEGIKPAKEVAPAESIRRLTGRKLDFAIIGLLVAAVAYFVSEKFVWIDEPTTEPRVDASIAVLPFVPLSSGEDDSYFADGLTEEILNALTQLPELQVAARTSSFFFKGQNIPVPEIADRLHVAHIVEGSVRRDGERVRITAQLIRASDGFHLWSQSYERTLDDVFAVQEDIAENIAEVLGVVLDDDARQVMRGSGIRDVEAFIAYQKGLELYATAHQGGSMLEPLALANAYFDRALEAAPDLAMARVMKADFRGHILFEIAAGIRDEEYPGEAQEVLAALREEYDLAVQLSPSGNQRDILDLERTLFSEDWSRLPARIQKAMQPGRCPQMNWTYVFIPPFGWAGHMAKKTQEALACNPMDVTASWTQLWSLIWAGDPEAALRAVEEADYKRLSHPFLEDGRYRALLAAGRINDPMARGPGAEGDLMGFDRQILREALAGNLALAREMAEAYWSGPDTDKLSLLVLAAAVGDRDRANQIAAQIDSQPGGVVALTLSVWACFCGATFDLEVAPNYKARIEEADFPWPPPTLIDYPAKDW